MFFVTTTNHSDADADDVSAYKVFAVPKIACLLKPLHFNPGHTMHTPETPSGQPFPITVGIDWADRQHVVAVCDHHGRTTLATLEQSPQAIDEWVADMTRRFPGETLQVAIEQSRGPLVHALMGYEQIRLYPINPSQLAAYRQSLSPSGRKNDPGDAQLLAQFLQRHQHELRPWQPDSPLTRKIARLAEHRRQVVQARQRVGLQLGSTLKQYFPLPLGLFPRLPMLAALLLRWPTLAQLQRAHPRALRAFLHEHHVTDADKQSELIQTIRAARPLTRDVAIIDPLALYAQGLARQILELNRTIDEFEKQLAADVAQHPDHKIFRSIPGAGDALVPRLIAAFGDDRDRYQSAEQIQCYSGIAPVTEQSGKTRHVYCRRACPKFLRQTFHEFADHARKWNTWSKIFYEHKRLQGFKHQAAVRALAFKWIRIIFQLWKTRTTYNDQQYLKQLQKRNSPLAKLLENT